MIARRRPVAALFTALLVWLTAVSTVRAAHPDETRWVGADADGVTTLAVAAARSNVVAARLPSRSSAIPHVDPPFPAAHRTLSPVSRNTGQAPTLLARVRRTQGLARTYDATAPPLSRQ